MVLSLGVSGSALALNRQGAGKLLADDADTLVVLKLPRSLLNAQVEVLLAQGADVSSKLVGGKPAEVFSFLDWQDNCNRLWITMD